MEASTVERLSGFSASCLQAAGERGDILGQRRGLGLGGRDGELHQVVQRPIGHDHVPVPGVHPHALVLVGAFDGSRRVPLVVVEGRGDLPKVLGVLRVGESMFGDDLAGIQGAAQFDEIDHRAGRSALIGIAGLVGDQVGGVECAEILPAPG
ncbi:Uncharacterised protein [Mycobacteroides abscessus subsp. abscessus]|nr:Uncharacterised protein [Mycobacteroides abscessus subsp. abscessus]